MKSTPVRGVKKYLKPYVYKQWKGYVGNLCPGTPDLVPFASWVGELLGAARLSRVGVAEAKASLNRASSRVE